MNSSLHLLQETRAGHAPGVHVTSEFIVADHTGRYVVDLERTACQLTIDVESNGEVRVVVEDGELGSFMGRGVIDPFGDFFAICEGGKHKICANGTLRGAGEDRLAFGALFGPISTCYRAPVYVERSVFDWVAA